MTLLCVPVFGGSVDVLRQRIQAALDGGADAIELRLDLMDGVADEDIRQLRGTILAGVPTILTIRSAAEGGGWDGDDDARVSRLIELGPFVDFVDVELGLWKRSANIRQKLMLALRRAGHVSQAGGVEEIAQSATRRLILSRHDQVDRPAGLHGDFVEMLSEPTCHMPKLAWRARTVRDNFEAFELMRSSPKPPIVICMGDDGLASRVLARKFGAGASFASMDGELQTAAGQIPVETLKSLYRWDSIRTDTRVYAVLGDPVRHSLSPLVQNLAFNSLGENAVFLPLRAGPSYEEFKAFMVEVLARPWMDFCGFSVTIPHKEHALRFLDESGGTLEGPARRIGAVNTIRIEGGGRLQGCNTDYLGAAAAIHCALADKRETGHQRSAVVRGPRFQRSSVQPERRAGERSRRGLRLRAGTMGRPRRGASGLAGQLHQRGALAEPRCKSVPCGIPGAVQRGRGFGV
jgi:3-dehydroquinate dehydratase/shikimate dehydrogenase